MQTGWAAWRLCHCHLSRTFRSRAGQYVTFYFTWSLLGSVASPDSVVWISWRYSILGNLRQSNSHSLVTNYSLTSYLSHWDSWPFASLWSFEFICPLTLSSSRALAVAWSSCFRTHPEYLCLAGSHTWHNIAIETRSQKWRRPYCSLPETQNCYAVGTSGKEMLRIWWASVLWFRLTNSY